MQDFINKIICGDNLEIMKQIPDNFIDLIYCDILYGTNRKFNDYQDLKPEKRIIDNFYEMKFMEMFRILKSTGSIYLQMDYRINHWIRLLMDDIFGYDNFINEIIWCYNVQGFSKNKFSPKHDNILLYSKTKNYKFYMERIRNNKPSDSTIKRFLPEALKNGYINDHKSKKKIYIKDEKDFYKKIKGHPPYDWFEISALPAASKERIYGKYDTQKPENLIKKFIEVSSDKNSVVADFFAGSGTTGVVAKKLNRYWILVDNNKKACEIAKRRLTNL